MIEVNLLPQDLRKEKKRFNVNMPELPSPNLNKVIMVAVAILVVIHIILTVNLVIKKVRLARLSKLWEEELGPVKKDLDKLKKDMNLMENKVRTIEQLTTGAKIIWSEKLNMISNVIPNGVWLTRIFCSENSLDIEGSAVSKKGEEMLLVGKFANNLKKEKRFYSGFRDLEVSSIKRRKIGPVEIVDFLIIVSLK
jgi:Tfp pilus assembly protein PilN